MKSHRTTPHVGPSRFLIEIIKGTNGRQADQFLTLSLCLFYTSDTTEGRNRILKSFRN